MKAPELLILVNDNDRELGLKEKQAVHRDGDLHRAISVFIFNTQGQMLLQRRAFSKYHSAGLWTNACCSHPRAGEDVEEAAQRRLREEMRISGVPLDYAFSFMYRAEVGNGLIEHELDHVFIGVSDELPQPDPEEVSDFAYESLEDIASGLKQSPEAYTAWFKLIFERVKDHKAQLTAG